MVGRYSAIGCVLALVVAAPLLEAQSSPAPLPQIALEKFPAPIRPQIQDAFRAAEQNPKNPELNGRLGMVLHAYREFESAAACYGRARVLSPDELRWSYYLGMARSSLGNHAAAVEALRAAHRLSPDSLPVHMALADALLAAGDAPAGEEEYRSILTNHPDSARAHHGLGRALAGRQKSSEAIEHFLRACELFPRFGPAHYALALAYRDAGEIEKSRPHLSDYQKNRYTWPPMDNPLMAAVHNLNISAHEHLQRGVALEEEGRTDEAIAAHQRALELDPSLVQAHANLITLYARKQQDTKAEEHYRGALALEPNLAEIHYNLGAFRAAQGRNAEAADLYRRALSADASHAEAHNNLASILMSSGELDTAEEHLRAAIRKKPGYRLAHFNLGRVLVQKGKLKDAIQQFLNTLTPEDESTPAYTYALGAAYARAGDPGDARKYLQIAREKALSLGQTDILAAIERDLRTLDSALEPR
jgi:tetratricopeptide (TPR) repeat protein